MCRIDNAGAYISNELKLFKIVHTELRFILSKVVYFFGSCRSSSHDISVSCCHADRHRSHTEGVLVSAGMHSSSL